MNIPIKAENQPFLQTAIGNAATGGAPNKPFMVDQYPRPDKEYRNHEESFHFPRFNQYWKQPNQSTYNPVKPDQLNTPHMGNAGNGDNQAKGMGAGKKPMPFEGNITYDKNSSTLEGSIRTVYKFGFNINEGEPLDIAPGEAEVVQGLLQDMDYNPNVKVENKL
jgi:hypothetical protein